MAEAVDSSKVTSADLRKQIMEQTQALADAATSHTAIAGDVVIEEEPETEETEKTEQAEEQEDEETKSEETETSEEDETKSPKKEPLYKLKVQGEIEDVTLERLIALAGQERAREKKNDRVSTKERELAEREQRLAERERKIQHPQNVDMEKAAEEFWQTAAKDPFGTLGMLVKTVVQNERNQESEQKKADRSFEREKEEEDAALWKVAKPIYDRFRDEGLPRDLAFLKAENTLLREGIRVATEKGVKQGVDKSKAKQRAEIPTGGGKAKTKAKAPSPDELRRMPAKEQKKYLPRAEAPEGW